MGTQELRLDTIEEWSKLGSVGVSAGGVVRVGCPRVGRGLAQWTTALFSDGTIAIDNGLAARSFRHGAPLVDKSDPGFVIPPGYPLSWPPRVGSAGHVPPPPPPPSAEKSWVASPRLPLIGPQVPGDRDTGDDCESKRP
jgi:hypothetical protein